MIDSHCHLSFTLLKPNSLRKEDHHLTANDFCDVIESQRHLRSMLGQTQLLGVRHFVLAGYEPADWQAQVLLKQQKFPVSTCFGLHPWALIGRTQFEIDQMLCDLSEKIQMAETSVDLLGEMGLDLLKAPNDEGLQQQVEVFEAQLSLATQWAKPVVLHVVQGHAQALDILKAQKQALSGWVHAFSADQSIAHKYIDLGLKISVGAGVYKKGYKTLKETIKAIGTEHLVLETDSPSQLGGLYDPRILPQVYQAVAELKNVPLAALTGQIRKNIFHVLPGLSAF